MDDRRVPGSLAVRSRRFIHPRDPVVTKGRRRFGAQSAVLAGIAGALYVPQVGIINPSEIQPLNMSGKET